MTSTRRPDVGAAARARAWHHAKHAGVCDVIEPWAHGTVARATRYPGYFHFNVVRVEDDPSMSVDALIAFADTALTGLGHRRLDFELIAAAEPLKAGFEVRGWRSERVLWMRQPGAGSAGSDVAVEEAPYDAVHDLRVAWDREDRPDHDPAEHHAQAREVAMLRDAGVFVVRDGAAPIAFAQLEREANSAEITEVYVRPEHRGRGLGTAITRAAVAAAGDADDLWICADYDGRPRALYARLGFTPAWTAMEFVRWPDPSA